MPPSLPSTAAIVVIGDEILSGKFAEENASYLIRELRELGVALKRIHVIPDVLGDIAETVKSCAERFDYVFTSGGVGPTHDDLTMEGIARAFGVKVLRHPELERLLRGFYGDKLQERNLRMAEVPEGCELLATSHPAWPVTMFRNIYILPGVPVIFRHKFESIRERFRQNPFHVSRVYCAADEGFLAAHLDAVVAAHPEVGVGSYPRFGETEFRVIITLESKRTSALSAAREDLVGRLPGDVVVKVD